VSVTTTSRCQQTGRAYAYTGESTLHLPELGVGLLGDFFAALRPSSTTAGPWRPLLLLNGTDAASGCRVLVSSLRGAGPTANCLEAATAGTGSQFATGALDIQDYLDRRGCGDTGGDQTLRLSTAALLSGRFAFVSPTGTVFRCLGAGEDPATAAVIDGGYLENSGMAALLELWEALEPQVNSHNRAVADSQQRSSTDRRPYVVPLFVVAENHYMSIAPADPPGRVRELAAPLVGRSAPRTVVRSSVLEQSALLRFAGPPPGLPATARVLAGGGCMEVRSFLVAPRRRPGVEAPLGWVLSSFSTNDLRAQLSDLERPPTAPTRAPDGARRAWGLPELKTSLRQPLLVRFAGSCASAG
jgi:hypothetical protein